jgi:hypothetical protein
MNYVPGILYVRTAGDLVTLLGTALLLRHATIVILLGKITSTLIILANFNFVGSGCV